MARRKRQARLSFTPLPSSSPAAKNYPKQIQDRAAAVTVQGSPAKKRKLRNNDNGDTEMPQLDGANDAMPTPAATSERRNSRIQGIGVPPADSEDSDDIPLVPTQRLSTRKRSRQQQQRLDFSNPREAGSFDSPVRLTSSARPQSSVPAGIFGSQRRRATIVSSEEESEEELPSPVKVTKKKSKQSRKEAQREERSGRETRSTRRFSQVEPESEEENIVVSSERQLPLEAESEKDEDDMPTTMATQRRKRTKKQASPDSFISSSPPPGPINSDDDLEIIEPPAKKRRRGQESESEDEDDDDDDAAPLTPHRRRLKRPRKVDRQEAADLADDLDFLGPSSDVENSSRRPRNTQTAKKDARQSALEKLKRKRSSRPTEPVLVEDDEEEEQEESEEGVIGYYDDYLDDDEITQQQPPISSRQYFAPDDEDENFIESESERDGEGGTLGFPDPNIPIAYTRFASMKAKDLFPFACEWMVQKKINPAFSMTDEVYSLTFRKLDDEVTGLKNSKFKSSVWTQQFKFALEARPEIAFEPLDRSGAHELNDHCDACNRSSHPATFQIQFQGKPYNVYTLEEVGGNDDSDSDSDSDNADSSSKPAWDAQGREIVPGDHTFYVGKFCMANAQTAHALEHWRYHLNEYVVSWLTRNGYLKPREIVKRDGWGEKKRRKHANKIADRMEKDGVVRQLWKEFRDNIDGARDAKQGGGGRW